MPFQDDDGISNPTANPTFAQVLEARVSRRHLLGGGGAAAALAFLRGPSAFAAPSLPGAAPLLGFESVPVSTLDEVVVPDGYRAHVLVAWGDPVSDGPAFAHDASNSTADQLQQWGMHNDGIHYFPLAGSDRGLLVSNNEYTDDGLLHIGGMEPWTVDKVAKSQAAHGVSVIEVARGSGRWKVVRPSPYARRISAATPITFGGPARGHISLRTALDPGGTVVRGTVNNCAHGYTPWGTYLACEENFNGYFVNSSGSIPPDQARYGISAAGFGYRWHEHDARFDAAAHPNEPNRFGWVVEIDPSDPTSIPVKRTALGRIKHEGAWVTTTRNGRVVVYMGDDERFEYIYKFVSARPWQRHLESGESPLDNGVLFVARFDSGGTGEWLPLVHGTGPLTPANGFTDQGDVLVRARAAADALGATRMDRPEWIAVHPETGDVYCTLTNNSLRGAVDRPPPDEPNPRPFNTMGHIIRWSEDSPAATTFEWDIFVLAGDPTLPDPNKQGNIFGDPFGSPDGLWFDPQGRLWIQTDASTSTLGTGDYVNLGNNQMLAADPSTGEIRRFLVGPNGCEVTGVITTPDQRAMFVNIQHPGEPASERNDPANPKAISSWPDGASGGRPRSSCIVITKRDGGRIGA